MKQFSKNRIGFMKEFAVHLHRDYKINNKARNEVEAKSLSEFCIGGEKYLSIERLKTQLGFEIIEIEMMTNEAIEINEE